MSRMRQSINIGLMGLGVVGSGVAEALIDKAEVLARQVGCPLTIRKILVSHPAKRRSIQVEPSLLTTNAGDILTDPEVDIVVEVIGGEHPALDYIREALVGGRHVVTANKEVMAKHGPELQALAQEHQVDIRYEASVGGGIPLIAPFQQDLRIPELQAVQGRSLRNVE